MPVVATGITIPHNHPELYPVTIESVYWHPVKRIWLAAKPVLTTISYSIGSMDKFARNLLAWFKHSGRHDLPWQQDITPYRSWVSEIMLQQTQVNTVIPYYLRFMDTFPELPDLADAEEDKVLHQWTGLGYYARARNLHAAAKILVKDSNGEFPSTTTELAALPGIGRSTAGAILSIAMNQRAAILDGNVKRVLARYHEIEGWPGITSIEKAFWQVAEEHTPTTRSADYTQAIMDLGATVCIRTRPRCAICPLHNECLAFKHQTIENLPHRKPKRQLPVKTVRMLIFESPAGEVHLEKRPPHGIWGSLWSFPEVEDDHSQNIKFDSMGASMDQLKIGTLDSPFRHTFSHYHLDIQPVHVKLRRQPDVIREDGLSIWYDPENPIELGLATPVKRLLRKLRGST
jgi:A/G-specific adenine glycosylase